MVELLDIRSKKAMKFLIIIEKIRIQVAKYSELWSLNVYRVHPHVPSLMTPPPSPYNWVQNKHGIHRCRVLYLCAVQRVLKTHWDSRRLDWTQLGRCEHPLTLESDWTGLDSTQLCWCVHTLSLCSSLNVKEQISHPRQATCKIMVQNILLYYIYIYIIYIILYILYIVLYILLYFSIF